MKLKTLIDDAARALGMSNAEVGGYARVLREAGFISTGGRGPGGAEMTRQDVENLFIGLCGSRFAKNSASQLPLVKAALRSGRQLRGEPLPPFRFLEAKHFDECLTHLLDEIPSEVFREWTGTAGKTRTQPNVHIDFHVDWHWIDVVVEKVGFDEHGMFTEIGRAELLFDNKQAMSEQRKLRRSRVDIRRIDFLMLLTIKKDILECLKSN